MATTEGALIASLSRGIKALNMSGGVTVRVIKDGITRGPVFKFDSIVEVERFLEWLPNNNDKIRAAAESTMQHGGFECNPIRHRQQRILEIQVQHR